jgi:signal transduction histidine kinase
MRASRRPGAGLRRLTVLLVLILVPPALTLIWLGAVLLERDRANVAERNAERRAAAAEVLTRALIQSMSEAERWLIEDGLPEGTIRLTRSAASGGVVPASRLLWSAAAPADREVAHAPFAEAERLEFTNSGDRGRSTYTALAQSADVAARAGALLRLGRLERRLGHTDRALQAYRDLAAIRDVTLDRTPVDLIARRMVCEILDDAHRPEDLAREASLLRRELVEERWALDGPAWALAARDVERWTGPLDALRGRRALTLAVEWLDAGRQGLPSSGRRVVVLAGLPVTMSWRQAADEFRALAALPSIVRGWLDTALARELPLSVDAALVGDSGTLVAGTRPTASDVSTTVARADSHLPWDLIVTPRPGAAADSGTGGRRVLVVAGISALVLLFAGSSYLLLRVVRRELAIARLQTEFVSAVSHEFRTPLTSLRHISDLLQENDDLPAGRRQSLYGILGQSAERLHRLVESLLDFARMEEGRRPWQLRPVDAAAIVSDLVESFRGEHPRAAIELDAARGQALAVEADAEALARAVWNLLDNAVKYSPDGAQVRIAVREEGGCAVIAVQDRGLGIPVDEQREIFGRFVRGRAAITRGISGTGLGLAMVAHIVDAHRGRLSVESAERQGSTFTIALPMRSGPVEPTTAVNHEDLDARQPL